MTLTAAKKRIHPGTISNHGGLALLRLKDLIGEGVVVVLRAVQCVILGLFIGLAVLPVAGKEGVVATVHTPISANAPEGSAVQISWTLADKDSGDPFDAAAAFVRLLSASGNSTESFADRRAHPDGRYRATVRIPKGGVDAIEIGIAGRITNSKGHNERSDWLIDLANNPITN